MSSSCVYFSDTFRWQFNESEGRICVGCWESSDPTSNVQLLHKPIIQWVVEDISHVLINQWKS